MLMMRWLARSSHRVVALSEKTRRDLIRAFRLPEKRTVVIPNVVDPAEFFQAKDRAALRRELKLDPDAFLSRFRGLAERRQEPPRNTAGSREAEG